MSSILEALRKSEVARRAGRAPVYRDGALPAQTLLLRTLSVSAGLVLLVALAASFWLLLRDDAGEQPSVTSAAVSASGAASPETTMGVPENSATADPGPSSSTKAFDSFATAAGIDNPQSTVLVKQPTKPRRHPSPSPSAGSVPWLSALPDSIRHEIPKLVITIHVYAPDARQRILYINNRPLRPGEEIEGVSVEEIVPEGAVMSFDGQRFRIPRPS